jgi:peptidoglycan hydrolase-like protein with peptidoglycan-binding domain
MEFGAARTPQEARRVISELLASLRAAGFPVPRTGSPEAQLKTALEQFQKAEGLPGKGELNKDTLDRLADAGHLEQKGKNDASGVDVPASVRAPTQDKSLTELDKLTRMLGGELGLPTPGQEAPADSKSPRKTEVDEKASAARQEKAPPLDMKSFVASMRAAGFAGQGKGAEQLKEAIKKLQTKEGLPVTGRIDTQTAEALVKRGVLSEAQARDLVPTTSQADLKNPKDAAQESVRTANDAATQDPSARRA